MPTWKEALHPASLGWDQIVECDGTQNTKTLFSRSFSSAASDQREACPSKKRSTGFPPAVNKGKQPDLEDKSSTCPQRSQKGGEGDSGVRGAYEERVTRCARAAGDGDGRAGGEGKKRGRLWRGGMRRRGPRG